MLNKLRENNHKLIIASITIIPFTIIATSFEISLGLSILFALIYMLSFFILKGLYKIIDPKANWFLTIIVVALITFLVQRLTQLFLYELYEHIGYYIILFITNISTLTLTFDEVENSKVEDKLKFVLEVVGLLLIFGIVREFLGTGTIKFGLVIPSNINLLKFLNLEQYKMSPFIKPEGGLILLGIMLMVIQFIYNKKEVE